MQAKASSSVSIASSMAPARSWISQPPSSCLSYCWPRRVHHRRAGDEHRRDLLHHHRVVRGGQPRRAQPGDRTEAQRHARHGAHVLHHPFPARTPGTLARPVVSIVLTEPPPPEPSIMRIIGTRNWLAIARMKMCFSLMVASAEPPRTVKSSPVTTTGRPSILAAAHHEVGRHQVDEVVAAVVVGLAGDAADLVEGARVEQAVDALAHGEAPAVVLALDLVRAAHAPRAPGGGAVRPSPVSRSWGETSAGMVAGSDPPCLGFERGPGVGRRPLRKRCR